MYEDQLEARYLDLVENSSVYDAEDQLMGKLKAEQSHRTVKDLAKYLLQAVVAVKEKQF